METSVVSDIEARFEQMVARIQHTPPNQRSSNASLEERISVYALFKQATQGNAAGARPGLLNPVARLKYDAHRKLSGLSKEEAMVRYLELVGRIQSRAS